MRRVTRENSWGKWINKQVTRWVGSRQIDMRARGTQKTRTEATCSHKTETQAHGQQTNHQPCAKQDMNTQLMRKLISHVFTQDMTTWKHAANEYTSCVPHSTRYNKCKQPIETCTACNTTKHTWTRVRGAERTRDRALTQWQKMERECPNPVTWPKLKTWVPGSKHHAHTRSRALTWKRGYDGSIRALSQNHE